MIIISSSTSLTSGARRPLASGHHQPAPSSHCRAGARAPGPPARPLAEMAPTGQRAEQILIARARLASSLVPSGAVGVRVCARAAGTQARPIGADDSITIASARQLDPIRCHMGRLRPGRVWTGARRAPAPLSAGQRDLSRPLSGRRAADRPAPVSCSVETRAKTARPGPSEAGAGWAHLARRLPPPPAPAKWQIVHARTPAPGPS